MIRITNLNLPIHGTEEQLKKRAARALAIPAEAILELKIFRRSLDARKKDQIHYVCVVDVDVAEEEKVLAKAKGRDISPSPDYTYTLVEGEAICEYRPVVVGFGPAGMFAALLLAEMGLKPIVLERGGDVESRKKSVDLFWKEGKLDTESNVQFGEGGAGTFSDGKLTTRIKDPRCRKVLQELVEAGAPEEILYDAKPHIGTDLLRGVVKRIREKIISLGGEVRFFTKVVEIEMAEGEISGVILADGEKIKTNDVILAVGHSARDTFEMLYKKGVSLEQKPFAMGVRIEHKQQLIDRAQFGEAASELPPADYQLSYTTKEGRGVYTFCMCPGGYVVAASSEEGRLAINGMSEHARDGENANAALLVQIFPEDFGSSHPLEGMYFQRRLEEKAFEVGGSTYAAPVESVGSFLRTKADATKISPTYLPKTTEADMDDIFPSFMTEAMREAIPQMGKKLRGFYSETATLTAIESRSSSPIRILRGENGASPSANGLYPIGEGAGYAGGIVSAAVDGILVAEKIFKKHLN